VSFPFYPPRAFCFTFALEASTADGSFQEISGLKVNWTWDEVKEGGQNGFTHRLPLRTEYSNLVLKRGVVRRASPLATWLSACFEGNFAVQKVEAKTAIVMLLDGAGRPQVQWTLEGAYPLSWDHSSLNATESNLLIETIELTCRGLRRQTHVYPDETNAA